MGGAIFWSLALFGRGFNRVVGQRRRSASRRVAVEPVSQAVPEPTTATLLIAFITVFAVCLPGNRQ